MIWNNTKNLETAKEQLKKDEVTIEFKSIEGGYNKGRTVCTQVFEIDGNKLTIKGRNRNLIYLSINDLAEYEFRWIED